MWWFYKGRPLSYEETLIEYQHETKMYPKFQPRQGIKGLKEWEFESINNS